VNDDEEFVRHLQSLGVPLSPEQRRIGLDRNTEEGALLAFSAALRPDNTVHRVVAWVLLVAFGLPVALSIAWLLRQTAAWLWGQAS